MSVLYIHNIRYICMCHYHIFEEGIFLNSFFFSKFLWFFKSICAPETFSTAAVYFMNHEMHSSAGF